MEDKTEFVLQSLVDLQFMYFQHKMNVVHTYDQNNLMTASFAHQLGHKEFNVTLSSTKIELQRVKLSINYMKKLFIHFLRNLTIMVLGKRKAFVTNGDWSEEMIYQNLLQQQSEQCRSKILKLLPDALNK